MQSPVRNVGCIGCGYVGSLTMIVLAYKNPLLRVSHCPVIKPSSSSPTATPKSSKHIN